jgi:predicted Zn finger-like uncharacterized protein
MEIQCPNCASRFRLSDSLARDGAKMRCSVCKHVFIHEAVPQAEENLPSMPLKEKTHAGLYLLLITLLVVGAFGLWWRSTVQQESGSAREAEIARKVELLTMRNVRQYYVDNENVGRLFVVEGSVVNEFPQPRDLITVEAAIYDKDEKLLAVKKQLAGVQLSLFQLQVLGKTDMDAFLNNKTEILASNTNVPHGGEVPFMLLFYEPPEDLAEFGVRIVDVQDPQVSKEKSPKE